MKLLAAIVLASATVMGAQSACSHSTAFRYVNHRIVVPVLINGHGPYQFLLDTGTQVTLMDPVLLGALHVDKPAGKVLIGGMGVKETTSVLLLQSIELDGHKVTDTKVVLYDLTKMQDSSDTRIMGILGQDFLERFNLVIYNKTSCVKLFDGYNP